MKRLCIFLVVLLGCTITPVISKKRRSRTNPKQEMYAKRMQCEVECLMQWIPEEAMNCIHSCRSPACFQSVYDQSLEPGQVDPDRADLFSACNLSEILDARKTAREERKKKVDDEVEENDTDGDQTIVPISQQE